jgi:hypothetical protein
MIHFAAHFTKVRRFIVPGHVVVGQGQERDINVRGQFCGMLLDPAVAPSETLKRKRGKPRLVRQDVSLPKPRWGEGTQGMKRKRGMDNHELKRYEVVEDGERDCEAGL